MKYMMTNYSIWNMMENIAGLLKPLGDAVGRMEAERESSQISVSGLHGLTSAQMI